MRTTSFMTNNPNRFPDDVEAVLRQSGWYPGRQVEEQRLQQWYIIRWLSSPAYCRIFPVALRVLREFGGIQVNQNASGITCRRSPFVLDPLAVVSRENEGWIYCEWMLEQSLYPLGVYDNDILLAIDTLGRVIEIGEDLGILADNFDLAVTKLIRGIAAEPEHILDFSDHAEKLKDAKKVLAALKKSVWLTKVSEVK